MFFVDSNLLQAFVSGAVCTHLFYRSMYTMCIDVANKTLKNNREREREICRIKVIKQSLGAAYGHRGAAGGSPSCAS